MPEPVLSVEKLSKSYGEHEALRGVSFDAHAGELVAIVGPNGAGKTTLLSILAGVQKQSSGTVSRPPGRSAGCPSSPRSTPSSRCSRTLELFARLEKVADPLEAVKRMLDQTGLGNRADDRVEKLSGGNRQRVNVALGLIADPPVLLLDEPSTALDPNQRERLWRFVAGLAERGRSVVFSSHIVGEVERHAQRALVLDRGEQVFDGPPGELAGRSEVDFESAFVAFLGERGH